MRGFLQCLLLVFCLHGICSAIQCTVIPGALVKIDAGNGQVFGVNSADMIYTLYGSSWVQVPGALIHVTVGPAGVWGVNRNNEIFRLAGASWTRVSGLLKQIDAGGSQFISGANMNDDIFCLSKSSAISADGSSSLPWSHIDGKLKYYSCGPMGCWGVNSADSIFHRHDVTPSSCFGSKWEHVSGSLSMIEVGTDGSVYGVNSSGDVYRRDGITACNPVGTGWTLINISLSVAKITHVTYDLKILWALTSKGEILKCQV